MDNSNIYERGIKSGIDEHVIRFVIDAVSEHERESQYIPHLIHDLDKKIDLSVAMLERRLEGLDKKLDLSVVNLEHKYDLLNQKVDSGMNILSSLMLGLGAAVLCGFSIMGYLIKL